MNTIIHVGSSEVLLLLSVISFCVLSLVVFIRSLYSRDFISSNINLALLLCAIISPIVFLVSGIVVRENDLDKASATIYDNFGVVVNDYDLRSIVALAESDGGVYFFVADNEDGSVNCIARAIGNNTATIKCKVNK